MPIFTISYDLIKFKDYPKLWDALKQNNAHRVMESLWLLSASNTSEGIVKWLQQYVDQDDKVFVTESPRSKVWFVNANAGTNKWLETYAPAYA